jgi:kumamolisin
MFMELKRGLKLCAVLAVLLFGLSVVSQAETIKTRHVYNVVAKGQVASVGHLPQEQVMNIDVMLPLSDRPALEEFLGKLYDRNSTSYHQFLTPEKFAALYGPSKQDYEATVRYLQTHGFTITGGSKHHMDIQARGPVSAVESAFHVSMLTYQHPVESRTFYSPDREPTTDLPFALWHVAGLDNYAPPTPALVKSTPKTGTAKKGSYYGSGPNESYLGSDMRAAYCSECNEHGYLQDMALLEYVGTDLQDVSIYYKKVGQTNDVPIYLYSTDGTQLSCVYKRYDNWCDDTEQTLDVTQALGMAPHLHSLTEFVGSTDTALLNALADPPEGINFPYTISSSWVWGNVDPDTDNPIFEEMAADGQSYFNASGDWSTWAPDNVPAWPADSVWVTAVGGTDLNTNGPGGTWKSETAWIYSGGGISPDLFPIPEWQTYYNTINNSNKGSTSYRNGPDVSANANFTFYVCADLSPCTANDYGGTSFAAPMWAAFVALVNEKSYYNGGTPWGFINPDIYGSSSYGFYNGYAEYYADDFHDITTGTQANNYLTTPFSAVPGYDLVTGWGSPIGENFIDWYYNSGCITSKPGAKPSSCCGAKPSGSPKPEVCD